MTSNFATIPPPPQRLLVFARLPELGSVKTRLAADIGDARALAVYEAMLRDLIANVGAPSRDTEIEFLWPPTRGANGALLRRAFGAHSAAMQTGATLGDRLSMAFSERFFFHRTQKIVAIGVDAPTLSRDLIDHAFALLDSCEFVIGPATDGGYYLIGCRALAFDPAIFQDIEWSTPRVFSATMQKIAAMQRTVAVLPERYDIDTSADLARFAADARDGELGALLREGVKR
ncbi:MAG TPA: TIGR04282 family arsenosugar biosynthesis glycosyltransferase [Thermoanaerobaculia bacterium]|nr:TIGR04282 family arsenosugar biosynthesis glycosyltransferase [Thermoanaerobaculia bacterium]